MRLQLVGCDRFVSPKYKNELVLKDQIIEVEQEDGEYLLELKFNDVLNNIYPLFVEVGEDAVQEDGPAIVSPAPVKTKRRART